MSGRKYIPSPGGILPNGALYEQIQVGHTVQYAVKTDKGISIDPFLEVGEHVVYQPLSPSPWRLPPEPIKYESVEELWKEIKQFVYDHLDIEDKNLYHVYVAWILVSWIPEKFDSVGYLHFHGPRNSGKTRGLDILSYLCFRPLLSPSASGATVFRALDAYHPTFLLDEFEMYEKMIETKAEVIGILNAGYRRGQIVLRMTGMKEGLPTIKGFKVFGPKALSSIEPLPPALESRCIRFPMSKTYRKIRRLIDKKRATELRGKLLQFRFSHNLEETVEEEGEPLDLPDGRLIEMFYPLDMVAPTQEIKDIILRCGRMQHDDSIQEDMSSIVALIFNQIIEELHINIRLQIPQHRILDKYNAFVSNSEKMDARTMGRYLKTLNFRKATEKKTRRKMVVIDADILERRKITYVTSDDMKKVNDIIGEIRRLQEEARKPQTLITAPKTDISNTSSTMSNREHKGSFADVGEKKDNNSTSVPYVTDAIDVTDVTDVIPLPSNPVADELKGAIAAKKCSNCGCVLNEDTRHFSDSKTGSYYCGSCFTVMREQGLIEHSGGADLLG